MTVTLALRIFAVVMMGWVVAHAARTVLMSLGGHERLTRRALIGEGLTALGAFLIGWGLLPGGTLDSEWLLMLIGCLVWAGAIVVQPPTRATPPST